MAILVETLGVELDGLRGQRDDPGRYRWRRSDYLEKCRDLGIKIWSEAFGDLT